MSDKSEDTSKGSGSASPDWHSDRAAGFDRAGRTIEKYIYALDEKKIIYFCDSELFYEMVPGLVKDMGRTDAALARINQLLPDNPKAERVMSIETSSRLWSWSGMLVRWCFAV
jgi:hypothetical protein